MLEENILKLFYQLGEVQDSYYQPRTLDEIMTRRPFQTSKLQRGLQNLYKQGYLQLSDNGWAYTKAGKTKGQRVTKLHRLWELYLTEYLRIAPDHVHEDAETIEHIITPELESRLEKQLKYPKLDPHQSEIPYKNL